MASNCSCGKKKVKYEACLLFYLHSTTWILLTVSKEVQEKADLSSFFSCQSGGGRYPYTSPGEPKYLMKYLKEMCKRFYKHCFQFREKHIYCSNSSGTVQVFSFWWYLFLTYTPYKTNWSLDKGVLRCVKIKWDDLSKIQRNPFVPNS